MAASGSLSGQLPVSPLSVNNTGAEYSYKLGGTVRRMRMVHASQNVRTCAVAVASEDQRYAAVGVLAAAAMIATVGPVSRLASEAGVEPIQFVVWRAAVGSAVVATIVGLRRPRLSGGLRGSAWAALTVAIAAASVVNLALFAAFDRAPIAVVLLIFYVYPAGVMVASAIVGWERLTMWSIGVLSVALAGMALVVVGGIGAGAPDQLSLDPFGLAMAALAAAAQVVYMAAARGYRTVPADVAVLVMLIGTFVTTATFALVAGTPTLMPGPALHEAGSRVAALVMVASTVGLALPVILLLHGIRRVGATTAGLLMLFEPVMGAFFAALILGERLMPLQVVGAVAILSAAALVIRR